MNKILDYTLSVQPMIIDEECIYVAKYIELEGCIGEGTTADEALNELNINAELWLEVREEKGLEKPKCKVQNNENYSGHLSLRLPKSLHKKISDVAKNDNISINQCINMALSEYIGRIEGFNECNKQYVNRFNTSIKSYIDKAITNANYVSNMRNINNSQYSIGGRLNGIARNYN